MIASLVITRTQMRFYQTARAFVNVFAPHQFRVARASRVLAMVSSPSRTSLTYPIKPAMKHRESSVRRDAPSASLSTGSTSRRDACALNYLCVLRPWRRTRARPRCRVESWSGRWSSGRRRCRRSGCGSSRRRTCCRCRGRRNTNGSRGCGGWR